MLLRLPLFSFLLPLLKLTHQALLAAGELLPFLEEQLL
jgi:hypothetical protein